MPKVADPMLAISYIIQLLFWQSGIALAPVFDGEPQILFLFMVTLIVVGQQELMAFLVAGPLIHNSAFYSS